jgi:glucosamine 6-phosphate synthetase-like amidotransferase/phosphosugar isomerase protein
MCGVFAFVSNGGKMDLGRVKRIAEVTEQRGPHAFGFAWVDSKGRLHCFKQTGRITDSLGLLAMAADARMLIGHCRYATHGDYRSNVNNHPHPADGGWVVHNGTLPEYQRVIDRHGLAPVTHCDSEVLGLLVEQLSGSLTTRCAEAVRLAAPPAGGLFDQSQPLVMLGLWSRPGRLVVVRRGNPLHFGKNKNGLYIGSLADELPGKPQAIRNGSVHTFGYQKDVVYNSLAAVWKRVAG